MEASYPVVKAVLKLCACLPLALSCARLPHLFGTPVKIMAATTSQPALEENMETMELPQLPERHWDP